MSEERFDLTLEELAQVFRASGIAATTRILADGIEAGVFPFARMIPTGGKKRRFMISRAGAERWCRAFISGGDLSV